MSIHIEAKQGEIADKILLPGDPLRAKFIAENFLEDAVCFNNVRGMLGFTGTYKGERVSVMGTGMGMPSISIYATELIQSYGVKKLIRVGTAGSLNKDVHVRELVLAQAAATTSTEPIHKKCIPFVPVQPPTPAALRAHTVALAAPDAHGLALAVKHHSPMPLLPT